MVIVGTIVVGGFIAKDSIDIKHNIGNVDTAIAIDIAGRFVTDGTDSKTMIAVKR